MRNALEEENKNRISIYDIKVVKNKVPFSEYLLEVNNIGNDKIMTSNNVFEFFEVNWLFVMLSKMSRYAKYLNKINTLFDLTIFPNFLKISDCL